MLKRKLKKAYVSIEAVILASIVIIGGLAGLSAFLKNGQGAQEQSADMINNTIDMIGEEFNFEIGSGDLPGGGELPDEDGEVKIEPTNFYLNRKYGAYNSDETEIMPIGEYYAIFREDGTAEYYSNDILLQTMKYTYDGTNLVIDSFGRATPGRDGNEMKLIDAGVTLITGEVERTINGITYVYWADREYWAMADLVDANTPTIYVEKEIDGYFVSPFMYNVSEKLNYWFSNPNSPAQSIYYDGVEYFTVDDFVNAVQANMNSR